VEATVLTSRELDGVNLQAVRGDITDLPVDAITNAANDHLWMGAGVAGAIKRRGGPSIEAEAVSKGPVPVGTAVATGAGGLTARHVIHAAVMGQDLRTELRTVATTTSSVLDLADSMGLASVAMPLLGTGVGGLDVEEVASTMAREVARAAERGKCQGMTVLLVGYDEAASEAVTRAVEGA
jgi:O-acetyl-ADP-ribose deacetylase (regulator of RNase III)